MDALKVSPASAGQLVMGKALAGSFYILLAGVLFFYPKLGLCHELGFSAPGLPGLCLFSIGLALAFGSFFERQQDVIGLTMLLLLVFIGAMFVDMFGLTVPDIVQSMLPWIPSVALMEIIQLVFLESIPWVQVWTNLGSVLAISALLYAVVIWKVSRSDR